jgi:hypothetical protein
MLIIHSNGSKWAGQEPDSIDVLKDRLRNYTLDKSFEDYGNFCYKDKGVYRLFGNFKNLSHVFRIDTDDKALVNEMRRLIKANKKRPDYNN